MFLDRWHALFLSRIRVRAKQRIAWLAFVMILLQTVSARGGLAPDFSGKKSMTSHPDAGMILISEGPFMMGSSGEDIEWVVRTFHSASREWYQDETPMQEIYLGSYYIDRLEVTNSKYTEYMQATSKSAPKYWDNPRFNKPDQPVVGVNFQEAVEYCLWAGKRLPSEAEWEKAARGEDSRKFPWGNEPDPTRANVLGLKDKYRYTSSTGNYLKGKSPYGVMDMAGNVWEWTSAWYQPYQNSKHTNEMFGQTLKVVRGGSWNSNMDLARTAIRGKVLPKQQQSYIGFRCVMQP